MFDVTVLGVDPGVAKTGLAVLERRDRGAVLAWSGPVVTPPGLAESDRLRAIAEAVRSAIAEHRPAVVALERVAFNRNTVSALQVARATGAVMVAASQAGLRVEEYAPSEVKSTVTGMGNADKRQVRDALVRVHGLREVPEQPDAADAVAVALCHLAAAPLRAAARLGARR
ncbi:MAG: crossover junction endodeoxyribonuclease RuvC [Actinobacteria bacterium]|nr:crossover junction endodeoxyribonuclease RuvC [Actinomycetota bacterium]